MRISVTDNRTAAHGGTSLSRNIGRDYSTEKQKQKQIIKNLHSMQRTNVIKKLQQVTQTSIANAFPIKSVQSSKC